MRNRQQQAKTHNNSNHKQAIERKIRQQGAMAPPCACPYCGKPVRLERGDALPEASKYKTQLVYICSDYPKCDAYVGVHTGTTIPLGKLADRELRFLRITLHQLFDKLWLKTSDVPPPLFREEAYTWLSHIVQWQRSYKVHIAHLTKRQCVVAIRTFYAIFKAYCPDILSAEEEERVYATQAKYKHWFHVQPPGPRAQTID